MLRPIVFALLTGLVTMPALAAESAYTRLDVDACRQVIVEANRVEPNAEWFEATCPGYGGLPVYYTEIDLRVRIAYGTSDMGKAQLWGSFSGFNYAHHTIEWRLGRDGAPFATIHRWFVSGNDGGADRQVLMIHKIAQPGMPGCTVGMIDATVNADANVLARDIADGVVRDFACGRDRAQWYGGIDGRTPDSTLLY